MKRLALALVTLAVLTSSGAQAQDPARAFKAALNLEMVDRNLPAAIEEYKKVAASGDRVLGAQALLRLAGCYEKQGSQEAQRVYAQLIKEYGDQAAVVAEARQRLMPAPRQATAAPSPFRSNASIAPWGGVLSPDGSLIASGQGRSIRVVEVATAQERTLSETACPVQLPNVTPNSLAWSPDARHLAYSRRRRAPGGLAAVEAFELRVLAIDSRQVQTLDQYEGDNAPLGFIVAWSPDSQRMAFARRRNPNLDARQEAVRLATVRGDVSSVGLSSEGEFTQFAWSPDARRLAVHTVDRGETKRDAVHVLTVPGGVPTPVQLPAAPWDRGRNWRSLRAWTPADELIVEDMRPGYSGTDVFAIPVAGGAVRKLCEGPMTTNGWACRDITPDGRTMLIRDPRLRRLLVRDLTTGADRPVTIGAGDEMGGTLSPDGRLLSFAANRDGRWALYVVPLDRVPVAQPVFVATPDGTPPARVQWASNGLLLAGQNGGGFRIYKVSMDSSTGTANAFAAQLNTDGRPKNTAAVSPDSRQIAVWSRDGAREGIVLMDRNGAGERLILEYRLRDISTRLAWTSSDELVFYDWADERGQWGLTTLDVNRGTLRRLPHGEALGADRWPAWGFGRGQQEIIYQEGQTLRVRSLQDGADRVLVSNQAGPAVQVGSAVVSPDGSRVAYMRPRYTDPARGEMRAQLRLVQTDGADDRELPVTGVSAVCGWSPDSRFLLYFDRSQQYRVLNIDTGGMTPLLLPSDPLQKAMQNDNPLCWNQAVAWAPDGSFLLLTTRTDEDPRWTVFEGVTYDAVIRVMETRR